MSKDTDSTIPSPDDEAQGAEAGSRPESDSARQEEAPADPGTTQAKNPLSANGDAESSLTPASESAVQDAGPDAGETSEATEEDGMSFFDHLEEVRWRLFRAALFFVVATIICGIYADFLVNQVLIGPLKQSGPNIVLQNLVPYGQISLYLQVVVFSAFVLSFPALAWQIWKFVEPGLHERERKASRFVTLFISGCFFTGIAFGYFVFLPLSLKFFAGFGSPLIKNNIALQDYISFFLGTLLTAGVVFELPFISYVLSRIGLLTPAFMKFYRKHAIVTMLVIAAIVTPSTDLVTQMVIAVPMIILYEISIFISAGVQRSKNRMELEANS
jgi:sec-independent protein translocase protein TatC